MTIIDPGKSKDFVVIYDIEIEAPQKGPLWTNGNGMKDPQVKDNAWPIALWYFSLLMNCSSLHVSVGHILVDNMSLLRSSGINGKRYALKLNFPTEISVLGFDANVC